LRAVDADSRVVVKGTAIDAKRLPVAMDLKAELPAVVAKLRHPIGPRVDLEAQRIPGAFVAIAQLRTQRQDGAGTHEERHDVERRLVGDPARALEPPAGR